MGKTWPWTQCHSDHVIAPFHRVKAFIVCPFLNPQEPLPLAFCEKHLPFPFPRSQSVNVVIRHALPSIVARGQGLEPAAGFASQVLHLTAAWLWARCSSTLCLSILICKMGIVIFPPHRVAGRIR